MNKGDIKTTLQKLSLNDDNNHEAMVEYIKNQSDMEFIKRLIQKRNENKMKEQDNNNKNEIDKVSQVVDSNVKKEVKEKKIKEPS